MTDKRHKFEHAGTPGILNEIHPAEGSAVEAAAHSVKQQQEIQDTMSKASEILSETSAVNAFVGDSVNRPAGYEEFDEYLGQSENEAELTKPFGTYCMEVDKAFNAKVLPLFQARVTQLHDLTSHKDTIAVPLTLKACWKLINDLESYLLLEVYNKSLSGVAAQAEMTPEYEMARAVYLAVMDKEHNGRNPHAYKC
ncbi:hypothetical protein VPHD239_0184 [Vibrio phage D239]